MNTDYCQGLRVRDQILKGKVYPEYSRIVVGYTVPELLTIQAILEILHNFYSDALSLNGRAIEVGEF